MHYKLQELPQLDEIEKIFFVGIKGVGVCPLAIIAHQAGFSVAGSDVVEEFITDESLKKEGIKIYSNFSEFDLDMFFGNTLPQNCLVVTTGAHGGFDNPQVKFAKNKGVIVLTQGQALGIMMEGEIFKRDDIKGIAIAGAHGKTTITSLLASSLVNLKVDPSYSVGTGELFPIGSPGHFGKGEYFVVEADEYSSEPVYDKIPKFLYLKPKYAIFNNIDFDHPDLFKSVDDIFKAFVDFAHTILSGGTLLINGDDKILSGLPELIQKDIKIKKYGEGKGNDYIISDIKNDGLKSEFKVKKGKNELGNFTILVPGRHNALNALAVISILYELGFKEDEIKKAILDWKGSKRRLEYLGKTKNEVMIFDDYGHHPEEIIKTLSALKKAYPEKKLIAIFQSHTYSRTKALLQEFAKSFLEADELILLPVFPSKRDTEQDILPNEAMVKAFEAENRHVKFIEKFDDVVEYVGQKYTNDEAIILTIGAGDVYKIAKNLTS